MEGKLLELAGDKVLGELLSVELPVVVVIVSGRNGGTGNAPALLEEFELEVIVIVVNGLCLLGEDKGDSSLPLLVKLGGIEYSKPHDGVLGCKPICSMLGVGAVGVLRTFRVSN